MTWGLSVFWAQVGFLISLFVVPFGTFCDERCSQHSFVGEWPCGHSAWQVLSSVRIVFVW